MNTIWPRLAGVVLLTLGCSGKTSSGAGPTSSSPPVAQADFAATYAQAACSVFEKCCVAAGVVFDTQACTQSTAPPTGGALGWYDPARAGECIALIRGVGDGCILTGSLSDQIRKVCDWVFAGQQAIGAPCGSDRDCAGSYDAVTTCGIDLVDGGLVSTCKPVKLGNAGDQCSLSTPCAAGLYCNELSVCAATIPAGQACAAVSPGCADGLLCVAGTCSPKLATGAACLMNSQCQSTTCYGGRCVASQPFTPASCAVSSSTP
jgi:hypothetical protein